MPSAACRRGGWRGRGCPPVQGCVGVLGSHAVLQPGSRASFMHAESTFTLWLELVPLGYLGLLCKPLSATALQEPSSCRGCNPAH